MDLVPATQQMLFMARGPLAQLAVLLGVTTLLVILTPSLVAAEWGENWGVMQWGVESDGDGDGIPDVTDNCPFVSNNSQANNDSLPGGDACQCGDVTGDGTVTDTDVTRAQENLLDAPLGGAFFAERCNVIGPSDGGMNDCDIADIFILQRFLAGSPVTVGNDCDAYLGL